MDAAWPLSSVAESEVKEPFTLEQGQLLPEIFQLRDWPKS